jgi:hypothetical protein
LLIIFVRVGRPIFEVADFRLDLSDNPFGAGIGGHCPSAARKVDTSLADEKLQHGVKARLPLKKPMASAI